MSLPRAAEAVLSRQQHCLPLLIALAHGDGGVCQRGTHIHSWMQIPSWAKASPSRSFVDDCSLMSLALHQAPTALLCAATEQSQLRFQSRVTTRMPALVGSPVYAQGSGERFGTIHHPPLRRLGLCTFLKVQENPV